MNNPRVIYEIHEDFVQSAAKANLGRELTEIELKRLLCVFMENDEFNTNIHSALIEAAEEAMEDDNWEEYDKMYKNTPLEKV